MDNSECHQRMADLGGISALVGQLDLTSAVFASWARIRVPVYTDIHVCIYVCEKNIYIYTHNIYIYM